MLVAYLASGCECKGRVRAETQVGSAITYRTLVSEAPELFTRCFDEQEQAITIMKGEVFFTGFSFEDFVVS
jgi:hypothetical protein